MPSRRILTKSINELSKRWVKLTGDREDLLGMCSISSCALYQAMIVNDMAYDSDYSPELVWGCNDEVGSHCWVSSSGKIYDPTFGQFYKNCPIYIGPSTPLHELFLYRREINSLSDFYTWEEHQTPSQGKINWFLDRLFSNDIITKNRQKYFTFKKEFAH